MSEFVKDFFKNLTWTCHICGSVRPDSKISVTTRDMSAKLDLPIGTAFQNVRYCNDNFDCFERSKTFSHFKKI